MGDCDEDCEDVRDGKVIGRKSKKWRRGRDSFSAEGRDDCGGVGLRGFTVDHDGLYADSGTGTSPKTF